MASNNYSIELDIKKVKSANISRYSDGYNYTSITQKMGDKEYMNISYEWKGDDVPEFALTAMDIIKNLGTSKASLSDEEKDQYKGAMERASKFFSDQAKKIS